MGSAIELSVRKRKGWAVYQLEGRIRGQRIRLSLGTKNYATASEWAQRVNFAIERGPESAYWPELRRVLPPDTFEKLAEVVGYTEKPDLAPPRAPTWADLHSSFKAEVERRIAIGKLRTSTWERYQQTVKAFEGFLTIQDIAELERITKTVVENFKVWRLAEIRKRKYSRGGGGLVLDAAILHRIFRHAIECDLLKSNPVRMEGRPGDQPESGAQPFTADQLSKLRKSADGDLLAFLLLRWTGLRGSDAVGLHWGEIDWGAKEINRLTQKRRKRVILPIHPELLFLLEAEHARRNPSVEERVLLNPNTGKPYTRPRLYERMLALGRRAEVLDAHPHRYRDTFAVDMLARGGSPYDVAKLLGDTIETIEKHYTPFVRELRERVRRLMENGQGLENWAQFGHSDSQTATKKQTTN
jgi:integrase